MLHPKTSLPSSRWAHRRTSGCWMGKGTHQTCSTLGRCILSTKPILHRALMPHHATHTNIRPLSSSPMVANMDTRPCLISVSRRLNQRCLNISNPATSFCQGLHNPHRGLLNTSTSRSFENPRGSQKPRGAWSPVRPSKPGKQAYRVDQPTAARWFIFAFQSASRKAGRPCSASPTQGGCCSPGS